MATTLIRDVLTAAGYQVVTASNGRSGIESAVARKPNLILLDVMMPKIDGYMTLSELKKTEATKNIPVVMVTAVGYEMNRHLAMNMGAVDYITKPVDIKDLRAKAAQYAGS
jgi:two-component system alkaline phosphatase synthesis response regulator PhoP